MKRFALMLMLALLTLPGCGGGAQQTQSIKTTLPDVQTTDEDDQRWEASGVVAAAVITRVWLPSDQTINELWRTASTDSLSGAELRVWHDNQLRAAVVTRKQLQAMLKTLPGHFGVQRQLLTLTRDMAALDPASTAMAHRKVVLKLQGQSVPFAGGRMQLLLAADPQSQGGLKLTLVPHQYRPKVTLLPRSHVQAALDGRMFPELMLRALVEPDQVLLLAPDVPLPRFDDTRPTPTAPTSQPSQTASLSPSEPASTQKEKAIEAEGDIESDRTQALTLPPPSESQAAIPFGLGQAILTGAEGRATLHQLVIIEASLIATKADEAD